MSFASRLALTGRTLFVNGASDPIAQQIARLGTERGASVVLLRSPNLEGHDLDDKSPCLLANIACPMDMAALDTLSAAEWDSLQRSRLRRIFEASAALIPIMARHGSGAIVNVVPAGDCAASAAIESAIIGLTRALAREGAPLGIRVAAVRAGEGPGAIALGVAETALFLLSDAAAYITGETLTVGARST